MPAFFQILRKLEGSSEGYQIATTHGYEQVECVLTRPGVPKTLTMMILSVSNDMLDTLGDVLSKSKGHQHFAESVVLTDASCGPCCVDKIAASRLQEYPIYRFGPSCSLSDNQDIAVHFEHAETSKYINELELSDEYDWVGLWTSCPKKRASYLENMPYGLEKYHATVIEPHLTIPKAGPGLIILDGVGISWHEKLLQIAFHGCHFKRLVAHGLLDVSDSREKAKRWAVISPLCTTSIKSIGIIVQPGTCLHRDLAFKLSGLLKSVSIASYIISCGKLNPSKLGNFPDISAYVILGCLNEIFRDDIFYFKPLITPFELLCILNFQDFWANKYLYSEAEVLKLIEDQDIGVCSCDESTVSSLVEVNSSYSLMTFKAKDYTGLPPSVAHVSAIAEGLKGTPRSYK